MEAVVSTYICLTFCSWNRNTFYALDTSLLNGPPTGRLTFGNQMRWFVPHWLEVHRTVKQRACLPFLHSSTVQKRKQFLSICRSTFLPILRTSEMVEPKQFTTLVQPCDGQKLPSVVCKPCSFDYSDLLSQDFSEPISTWPERSSCERGAQVLCRHTFYCTVNKQQLFLKGSNATNQFRASPIPNIWFWSSAYVTNRWST